MTSTSARELRTPPVQEEIAKHGDKAMPLAAANRSSDGDKQCRICLDDGGHDFIQPCMCSGTAKWVHRECLDKWRVNPGNPRAFYVCLTCGFEYQLTLVRALTEDEEQLKKRRRRFMRKVIGEFILGVCSVQIWTIGLGVIIRICDSDMRLQKPFEPMEKNGFLVRWFIRVIPASLHNFTEPLLRRGFEVYYFAAIVATLSCVGFLSFLGSCSGRMCDCHRCCDNCAQTPLGGFHLDLSMSSKYDCCFCCGPCCECFGDCCYFCEKTSCSNGDCPGCDTGDCRSEDCNCSSFSCSGDDEFALFAICCAVIALVAYILFFVFGVFYAIFVVLIWMQKMMHRYATIKELRQLTSEYIVEDQHHVPSSGYACGYGSSATSSSLKLDLSAAYGYEIEMCTIDEEIALGKRGLQVSDAVQTPPKVAPEREEFQQPPECSAKAEITPQSSMFSCYSRTSILHEVETSFDACQADVVGKPPEITPQNDHARQLPEVTPQVEIVPQVAEEAPQTESALHGPATASDGNRVDVAQKPVDATLQIEHVQLRAELTLQAEMAPQSSEIGPQAAVVLHDEVFPVPSVRGIRSELMVLKLRELREKAQAAGADQMQINAAEDADNPRTAMAELVLELSFRMPQDGVASTL